jgi:hypothetical protein
MFRFDRRSGRQRAARQALLPAVAASVPCYLLLDAVGTRMLGGFWGVVAALAAVGIPLGALWWAGETGQRPRQAWRAGIALTLAAIVLYTWVFAGRWW